VTLKTAGNGCLVSRIFHTKADLPAGRLRFFGSVKKGQELFVNVAQGRVIREEGRIDLRLAKWFFLVRNENG